MMNMGHMQKDSLQPQMLPIDSRHKAIMDTLAFVHPDPCLAIDSQSGVWVATSRTTPPPPSE
jgi:hypothetical protein